jgi:hypothetical protein
MWRLQTLAPAQWQIPHWHRRERTR